MKEVNSSYHEPHNRQTRLADHALEAVRSHPEYKEEERLIVFLDNSITKTSAIGISGYDDPLDPMVNLFMHLRAMFASVGKELLLVSLGQG